MQPTVSNKLTIFKFSDVVGGSIIGGTFAAAYFFYVNFIRYGKKQQALAAAFFFAIGVPLLFVAFASLAPATPLVVSAGLYSVIIVLVAWKYMKPLTNYHQRSGGEVYSASKAAMQTLVWMIVVIVVYIGGHWLYFRSQDQRVTLSDTVSMLVFGNQFDTEMYSLYTDEFTKNDTTAIADFQPIYLNTDDASQMREAARVAKRYYLANQRILAKIENLRPFPEPVDREVTYLNRYNALRIEWLDYIIAATNEPGFPDNSTGIIKANQTAQAIDQLNSEQLD